MRERGMLDQKQALIIHCTVNILVKDVEIKQLFFLLVLEHIVCLSGISKYSSL